MTDNETVFDVCGKCRGVFYPSDFDSHNCQEVIENRRKRLGWVQ